MARPRGPYRVVGATTGVWEDGIRTLPLALRSYREAYERGIQPALYDSYGRRIAANGSLVEADA